MSSPFCTARDSLRYKRRARLPASSSSAAKGPSLDLPDYYDYKPPWTSLKRSLSRGNSNNNKRRSANAAANAKLSANAAAAREYNDLVEAGRLALTNQPKPTLAASPRSPSTARKNTTPLTTR